MGGAYGHMNHPFDLSTVRTGDDLIQFFYDIITSMETSPAALKLDGVNASIKVVKGDIDGRQFAGDRGSSYEVDVSGVTKARVAERWFSNPTHGMIGSYRKVLDIFNESLPKIKNELQQLRMWDNPSRYFNIEFVEVSEEDKRTNVVEYDRSYIAIHGLAQFYEKKVKPRQDKQGNRGFDTTSRRGLPRPILLDDDGEPVINARTGEPKLVPDKGVAVPYNKETLETLVQIMRPIAAKHGFDIYSSIPTKYKSDVVGDDVHKEFERVLNTPLTLCVDDSDCPLRFKLRDWLGTAKNPKGIPLRVKGKTQTVDPLNKDIYLYGLAQNKLADLLVDPELQVKYRGTNEMVPAVRAMVDAIVFWETIKNLGHVIKNSLTSDKFGDVEHQEGVVVRDKKFGSMVVKDPETDESFEMPLDVKITGDFITQGLDTPFGKVNEMKKFNFPEGHPYHVPGDLGTENSKRLTDYVRAKLGELPVPLQIAIVWLEPTGISAWPHLEDANKAFDEDPSMVNAVLLGAAIFMAVPMLGKIGKIGTTMGQGAMGAAKLAGSAKLAKLAEKLPGLTGSIRAANRLLIPAGLASLLAPVIASLMAAAPEEDEKGPDTDAASWAAAGSLAGRPRSDKEREEKAIEDAKAAGKTIAVFPGSFKPPHRGHIESLQQLVLDPSIGLVRILVSDPQAAASVRTIAPGVSLGAAEAVAIWKQLLSGLDIPEGKVRVEVAGEPSSFLSALKYVEEEPEEGGAPKGATVVFGCGDKSSSAGVSDASRFDAVDSIVSKGTARADLTLAKRTCKLDSKHSDKYSNLLEKYPKLAATVPNKTAQGDPDRDFHASDFRHFLKMYLNPKTGPNTKGVVFGLLKDFVPEPKEDNINSILQTLAPVNPDEEVIEDLSEDKKKLSMHSLFSLVEEVISEISGMGMGSIAGYSGPVYKRDKDKKKKKKKTANIYKLEDLTDTITNILENEDLYSNI